MKNLIMVGLLIVAATGVWAVDNSRDILKDQETVIGNVIDTGVLGDNGLTIKIDTSVDCVVAQ